MRKTRVKGGLPAARGSDQSSDQSTMENTLCGFEIDPLTGSGHFFQLFFMIGLPTIPVIALVIYSSFQLAAYVQVYYTRQSLVDVFPSASSAESVITALAEEMGGVASYKNKNDTQILGSLLEFYEATNVAVESVDRWPPSNQFLYVDLSSGEKFKAYMKAHQYNDNTLVNATVLDVIHFYDDLIDKFVSWVSQLLQNRAMPDVWPKIYAFESLMRSFSKLGTVRALGTTYYFNGQLTSHQLATFLQTNQLLNNYLTTGQIFDTVLKQAYESDQSQSSQYWKSLEQMQTTITQNANIGVQVSDGLVWYRKSTIEQTALFSLLQVTADDIVSIIYSKQGRDAILIGFYAISILIMILCMVPISVSTALSTTDSLLVYAHTMERKSAEIKREKRKTERLLNEMLPKSVAYRLRKGEQIEAEQYQSVTVFFSDISDFTDISITSVPIDIVFFLNDLYNFMDKEIVKYDVYKVETISCVYMVVSGLPSRNGERHSMEIARLSLDLLKATNDFVIPHMPLHKLQLRIGIHTGPCVAGVVGNKMPRYCLFGDTVNTASRMQSNGLPRKIHLSTSTYLALNEIGGFRMEPRGEIVIKGKGTMVTYWLIGKEEPKKPKHARLSTTPAFNILEETMRRNQSPVLPELAENGGDNLSDIAMPPTVLPPPESAQMTMPGKSSDYVEILSTEGQGKSYRF